MVPFRSPFLPGPSLLLVVSHGLVCRQAKEELAALKALAKMKSVRNEGQTDSEAPVEENAFL
jgi:hypothetical protein